MSYNNNNQYGGYGGSQPYARDEAFGGAQNQNRPPPAYANGYGGSSYYGQDAQHTVEMEPLNSKGTGLQGEENSTFVLEACEEISSGVKTIDTLLDRLQNAHRRALNDTDTDQNSGPNREIDNINADILAQFKGWTQRMKTIKSRPDARSTTNARQVDRVERELKQKREKYMTVDNDYQKRMRAAIERQYRITRPDATDAEVQAACEDTNQQVFSQAIMNSSRRGESQTVLSAVKDRHIAIQKIERQMQELAKLFEDMATMVVEQEPMIQKIEEEAVVTHENVEAGVVHLGKAEVSARAARRKKWICLGIALIILIIIGIVIAIAVTQANK